MPSTLFLLPLNLNGFETSSFSSAGRKLKIRWWTADVISRLSSRYSLCLIPLSIHLGSLLYAHFDGNPFIRTSLTLRLSAWTRKSTWIYSLSSFSDAHSKNISLEINHFSRSIDSDNNPSNGRLLATSKHNSNDLSTLLFANRLVVKLFINTCWGFFSK